MALDGFSLNSLKTVYELSSAQLSNEVKKNAEKDSEIIIKDIDDIGKKKKVVSKKEEEEEQERHRKNKEDYFLFEKEEEDGAVASIVITHEQSSILETNKKYLIRLNVKTEIFDIVDEESGQIVSSLTAVELENLIKKIGSSAGIIVNQEG